MHCLKLSPWFKEKARYKDGFVYRRYTFKSFIQNLSHAFVCYDDLNKHYFGNYSKPCSNLKNILETSDKALLDAGYEFLSLEKWEKYILLK